jgi:transcription elongation factor Elf1
MNATRPQTTTACSTCGSESLISVSLQESQVLFWTCAICETTGWERAGTSVSRDDVISLIPRR